jgi:hypothetical protein
MRSRRVFGVLVVEEVRRDLQQEFLYVLSRMVQGCFVA